MSNAALQMEKFKTNDQLLPARGPNIYNAGIKDNDKGYVKYGPKSSDQPNLMIIDPIEDNDGNIIMPGYYQLLLSYDRTMLILAQSEKIIALIPVFKLEEDKKKEELKQPMDNKSQKQFDKKKAKEEKKNKKLIQSGKMMDVPQIYNKASIEYDDKGQYYLIKYERGALRAWGTIKI